MCGNTIPKNIFLEELIVTVAKRSPSRRSRAVDHAAAAFAQGSSGYHALAGGTICQPRKSELWPMRLLSRTAAQ
jgi:hypothetical protein